MRRIGGGLLLLGLAIASLSSQAAPAPAPDDAPHSRNWEQYRAQARQAFSQKEFDVAAKLSAAALAEAEKFGPADPRLFESLNELGCCQAILKDYRAASEVLRRALAISEKNHGPSHVETGYCLARLAEVCALDGNDVEAEKLFLRAAAIVPLPEFRASLARIYQRQNKPVRAEACFRQAMEQSPPGLAWALALKDLASFYVAQTNYAQARPLLERSLAAQEEKVDLQHPSLIPTLRELGVVCEAQHAPADAETAYRRIVEIREQTLPRDHIELANSQATLAEFYLRRQDYAAAEPLYRQMLAREERQRGKDSINLAPLLANLVTIYSRLERAAELEAIYRRQVAVFSHAFGPAHPSVAGCLEAYASLLRKEKRDPEAADMEAAARAARNGKGR